MKNKTNSNTLRDTSIKILRPRSVFKKEVGPIKIISKKTKNKDNPIKKNNDENKDIKNHKAFNKLQEIQTLIKKESSLKNLCKQ